MPDQIGFKNRKINAPAAPPRSGSVQVRIQSQERENTERSPRRYVVNTRFNRIPPMRCAESFRVGFGFEPMQNSRDRSECWPVPWQTEKARRSYAGTQLLMHRDRRRRPRPLQ
jgi:hypothetical protein